MWVLRDQGRVFEHVDPAALTTAKRVDAGEPDLSELSAEKVLELNFPSFADGRGFSLARRLRRQHGSTARIVATGHLIPDQARMAFQSGFDEIWLDDELVARHGQPSWRASVQEAARGLYISSRHNRLGQLAIWDDRHASNLRVESLSSSEAYEELQKRGDVKILDVRTPAEWQFVGKVKYASVSFVEWKSFPDGQVNANFVDEVRGQGITPTCDLFVICRSGVRSLAAANLLLESGFKRLTNISDGFEGDLNAHGRRGSINGWKASGLPWYQE